MKLGFGSDFARAHFSFNGYASAMKAGLEASDMLSTVSRRYGYEIQTAENGYGLDWLTRQRANRLIGITNGVDYEVWNPATDPELPAHFDAGDLSGKRECKRAMLEHFRCLSISTACLANITGLRLRGYRSMMQVAGEVLATGAYIVSLGSGESEYEKFWQSA